MESAEQIFFNPFLGGLPKEATSQVPRVNVNVIDLEGNCVSVSVSN
jgi:hypothetical protein